jgi:L-rhamnose mutarotase
MQRMAHLIGIKPDAIAEYKRLHREVWPEVLAGLSAANIRNYSIYLMEPDNLLFSYWEYHGHDLAADVARMLASGKGQAWWNLCAPLQAPLDSRQQGEWWARMDEIFHLD